MIPELSTRWERDLGHDSAWKISLSYQWLSPATHLNETAMYQGIAVYCFSATYTPVCVLLLWETVTKSSRHWVASNPDLSLKQSFIDCGIGSRGRNQRDFFFPVNFIQVLHIWFGSDCLWQQLTAWEVSCNYRTKIGSCHISCKSWARNTWCSTDSIDCLWQQLTS